jgi:hypothetical protein
MGALVLTYRETLASLVVCLSIAVGCGSSGERPGPDEPGPVGGAGGGGQGGSAGSSQGGSNPSGTPKVGAHALSFYRYNNDSPTTIGTSPMATRESGSTLVVSVGRGDLGAHALPTDNKGNGPFTQLGTAHPYTNWPGSGTAVYAFPSALGGADHVVAVTTPSNDEVTLAAVEVVDASRVQDQQWTEVLSGDPLTTLPVTTTGPATLVAFWWGDAGVESDKTAVPNNGFTVVESILESGELVQCAVAVKEVATAGTYDVTWESTPQQGAQLWLVAVQ